MYPGNGWWVTRRGGNETPWYTSGFTTAEYTNGTTATTGYTNDTTVTTGSTTVSGTVSPPGSLLCYTGHHRVHYCATPGTPHGSTNSAKFSKNSLKFMKTPKIL